MLQLQLRPRCAILGDEVWAEADPADTGLGPRPGPPNRCLVKGFEDALARAWLDGQSQSGAQCRGDGTRKKSPSETSSRRFVLPARKNWDLGTRKAIFAPVPRPGYSSPPSYPKSRGQAPCFVTSEFASNRFSQ